MSPNLTQEQKQKLALYYQGFLKDLEETIQQETNPEALAMWKRKRTGWQKRLRLFSSPL